MLVRLANIDTQNMRRQVSLIVMSLVPGLLLIVSVALVNPQPSAAEEAPVTICHRNGSEHNPYVAITVDAHALPAHLEHGDIYPIPTGGCSTSVMPTSTPTEMPTSTPTVPPTSTPTSTSTPTEVPDPGLDG
jgi:hypothetical protein